MQLQSLLAIIVFANIFLAFSLPIQYADGSNLEVRFRLETNEASLLYREYPYPEERNFDHPELVQRQNNDHTHATTAAAATVSRPPSTAEYTMSNGGKFLHTLSASDPTIPNLWVSDKYTGVHVAQAIENFHLHSHLGHPAGVGGSASTLKPTLYPHQFHNSVHRGGQQALFSHLPVGPGGNLYEFPLTASSLGYHGGKPGAARIIMQHHPPTAAVNHDCGYSVLSFIGTILTFTC